MLKLVLALGIAATLVGCATPASFQAMTVNSGDTKSSTNEALKSQVKVRNVTGGKETNPLWTSQVDSAGFKAALEQSIANAGYQGPSTGSKYMIDAELQDLTQPAFGLTFDVQSTVSYRVFSDAGSKTIPITAKGTATPSDTFVAAERLRLANERSIKENIKQFLDRLATTVFP